MRTVTPTGRAKLMNRNEFIVTKTDTRGVITYANDVFLRMAEMTEEQAFGAPHSVIRHPDMPRAVFSLLWDEIAAGHEVFAYVNNLAASGDHYWVLAHVTPSYDADGHITGYHSNRRAPDPGAVEKVSRLYRDLKAIEDRAGSKESGIAEASQALVQAVKDNGFSSYEELVFSL